MIYDLKSSVTFSVFVMLHLLGTDILFNALVFVKFLSSIVICELQCNDRTYVFIFDFVQIVAGQLSTLSGG